MSGNINPSNRSRIVNDSGLAFDAAGDPYDVTAWRERMSPVGSNGGNAIITDPDTGAQAKVNDDGQLHVVLEGHVCTENSTSTPLGADEVWVGGATNILAYNAIALFVTSDAASAIGGLEVHYSIDGVTWFTGEAYTILAGAEKFFTPPAFGAYFRIQYTNGAAAQTTFTLNSVARKTPIKWSSHNIEDPITDQDDATLTKAVITGKQPNGNYDNVSLTNNGNMKCSIEELENQVSDDSNAALKVSPYMTDEFANVARLLGDNIFLGAPIVIASEHHEIHCGDSYEATYNISLGNGASLDFLITVPNWGAIDPTNPGDDQSIKIAHLVGLVEAESELEVQLWEAPTVVTAGTAITSVNRNFNASQNDVLGITQGGSVSADGTSKWGPWRVGSGRSEAGSYGRNREFILKNNTVYLFRITNQTTSNNNVNVEFDYYVHPGV
jgi:hypothetical protein